MSQAVPDAELAAAAYAIGVLRWEHERRVAAVLARAFADDPLVIAICDAPVAQRRRRMEWGFRVAMRSHCLAAQPAWTIEDATAMPVGVVLVTRPRSQARPSARGQTDLWFGLRAFIRVGLRSGLRGLKAAQIIARQAPTEPFTYLRTLGVDPPLQGRGLGARLVEQVVRTSPASLPVYLETAKEQNLSFYARHGFKNVGEFRCLGVPVWRLIRRVAA